MEQLSKEQELKIYNQLKFLSTAYRQTTGSFLKEGDDGRYVVELVKGEQDYLSASGVKGEHVTSVMGSLKFFVENNNVLQQQKNKLFMIAQTDKDNVFFLYCDYYNPSVSEYHKHGDLYFMDDNECNHYPVLIRDGTLESPFYRVKDSTGKSLSDDEISKLK
jgi:hypothetical protein